MLYRVISQTAFMAQRQALGLSRPLASIGQFQPKNHHETFLSKGSIPMSALQSRSMASMGDSPQPGTMKFVGMVTLGSALLAGLYTYWQITQEEKKILTQIRGQKGSEPMSHDYILEASPPNFEPSRKIRLPGGDIGIKFTLFQYQTCPFCCKARSFFDYFGINYDVVEVNSVRRTQVKWSKYKKVPIVVAELPNGAIYQLNDSTLIISVLRSLIESRGDGLAKILSGYPKMTSTDMDGKEVTETMNRYFLMFNESSELNDDKVKKAIANERKWRQWVDQTLVHTLSPNVYRTPNEALEAFRWFDKAGNWEEHFKSWERSLVIFVGAYVMYFVGKRLKKRHGLKPDVRQSLYDEVNFWLKSIKTKKTPFMGGEEPDLSDLAVYGVLSAIEGCEAFTDLQKNTSVSIWYNSMKQHCVNHTGQKLLKN